MGYCALKRNERYREACARNRKLLHSFLLTHPCVGCGETDPVILQFDHLLPEEKKMNVSTMANKARSVSTLTNEMLKCVIRCANCHLRKDNQTKIGSVSKWCSNIIARNKDFLTVYKSNHPCMDCEESDPVVLQFDHLSDKRFGLSVMGGKTFSLKRIKEEIDKCEVRCANCHIRKTARQRNYYRAVA